MSVIVVDGPSARSWTLAVVLWTLLVVGTPDACRAHASKHEAGQAAEILPGRGRSGFPGIVIRLAPLAGRPESPSAFGAFARAHDGLGRAATLFPPERALSAGGNLGLDGLPGLALRARETGALGIEDVFGDLAPADEPLARTYRLLYPEGTDRGAAARTLVLAPEVEWAEPDAVFHLAWDGAERFLSSVEGAAGEAAVAPGEHAARSFDGHALPSVRPQENPFLPDDPLFVDESQWGLWNQGTGPFGGIAGADIRAPEGWPLSTGSSSTILAIVDTGFDLGHPDLAKTLADGTPRVVRAYNSSIEGPSGSPADSVGHGTMVAGVALALTNNGPLLDGRGVAGVCGGSGGDSIGCRVVEVKATPTRLTDALGTELARGILFASDAGARAVNLSFGGDEDSRVVRAAIEIAAERGTVVVCGAGNGQTERPQYPGYYARYGLGVSVAALRSDGTLARFSTRGPQIDVAAPGENIYSTYLTYENAYQNPRRNFEYTSGTSFAAPHVTGLAGLAYTLQPSLTDNEFQEFLRRTAEDIGPPGRDDTFGWGVPQARRLLERLTPARSFERGTVLVRAWTLVGVDSITLARTDRTVGGCGVDGRYQAERWEGRAHVALPPGRFLETPEAIVRVHGTRGYGPGILHEYDLNWGEVVPGTITPDGFDVRTYLYRIPASPELCTDDVGPIGYLPGPPGGAPSGRHPPVGQIAWSAFGRRCFAGELPDSVPGFSVLPVTPNPARGRVTLRYVTMTPCCRAPAAALGRLSVYDIRGRAVRAFEVPIHSQGQVLWDGRDDAGRAARPGLYLLRLEGEGSVAGSRFIYLGVVDQ